MLNLTYFLANFDRKDQREKKIIRCVTDFSFGKTLPIYSMNEKKKKGKKMYKYILIKKITINIKDNKINNSLFLYKNYYLLIYKSVVDIE